jgi:protocatechuate 3,4-dioxygenase beta subunit
MHTNEKRMGRREALALLGVTSAVFAAGCASESPTSPSTMRSASDVATGTTTTGTTGTSTGTSGVACSVTPNETVGPYPSLIDLFRSDIRESKSGTQLDLTITVINTAASCAPLAGVNVEIWQCDAGGNYSQYGSERAQTYLRGIQTSDANGQVKFTTIYPGWYQGRATHIHVEVTQNGRSLKVTQIAFPESTNAEVYGTGVYASRGSNPTTNARDGIFADSLSSELATVSGSPSSGYTANFTVGLAA